jgi:hypothetical protein
MPYSTTISALDLSGGVPNVRVIAGYAFNVVGGANPGERRQDEVTLDLTPAAFLSTSTPPTFAYAGNLAPPPSPTWSIALWIQEIPRIPIEAGWLFRSGPFTTEPPAAPIEVILAPESFIGAAELAGATGAVPVTTGSTTITAITTIVTGSDIALTATGTDTGLPAGVTFTYMATLTLIPNAQVMVTDRPLDIRLSNATLGFTAGVGTGLSTALLNAISGIILGEIQPRIFTTLRGRINTSVLSTVATRLNRGVPSTMPPGVVRSIRNIRGTTRPLGGGTEGVIGVLAALGAFGGVLNRFPPLTTGSGCFIATAAMGVDAPEVEVLRDWRDASLRSSAFGRAAIRVYERLSPPLARVVGRRRRLRSMVRGLVVRPAAWLVRRRR